MHREVGLPLSEVPRAFAAAGQSQPLARYLARVLELCPRGGRTLEVGLELGFGAVWLSRRGVAAAGLDDDAARIERVRAVNQVLGGRASFAVGSPFALYAPDAPGYDVIHHQGLAEHFDPARLRALLAQQVASARWVVFSVPSVYYPFEPEQGDERLLPIEEWRQLLAPFEVEELSYYGDPQLGGREHILAVLRGQAVDEELAALMQPGPEPYPLGISAIVHTRDEEARLRDCLASLQGWTDEIIVCDMDSTDATLAIAAQFADQIVAHPLIANFDRARNVSAMRARYRWVLYIDADERVPAALGERLRELITTRGDAFEALVLPMRHHFGGHWLRCLYPGYTAPRLLRNGRFCFHARLHAGAQVDGRVLPFPADDPALAITHYSYDSTAHYLTKLNRYTDGEAANGHRDGRPFHWRQAVAQFVGDFAAYYDQMGASRDGVPGFLYSFMSGFYRFAQNAKLFELRRQDGRLSPAESEVPASVEEVLEFALQVLRQPASQAPPPLRVDAAAPDAAEVVWEAPWSSPSGYGEESRQLILAADQAGVALAVPASTAPGVSAAIDPSALARLRELGHRPARPGFIQVHHNIPYYYRRHEQASVLVGRTMFETDRIPEPMRLACAGFDHVWVPSAFNRRTFADAGLPPDKLTVIPGCFDPADAAGPGQPSALTESLAGSGRFVFLSVFDWTLRKGWDVLLRAFLAEFAPEDPVLLVLKVWSALDYGPEGIGQQAASLAQAEFGWDLAADARVRFVHERLSRAEMTALYRAADAFVMPSRGEGWGRPYLDAMAVGKPTIGTGWSGNTEFMTADNSYLIDCQVRDVSLAGWHETPIMKGHRWAEPEVGHLRQLLRRVTTERGEAAAIGERARDSVHERFSQAVVGQLIAAELERLRELHRPHPALPALPALPVTPRTTAVSVRWEGACFETQSLALVNNALCAELADDKGVELSLLPLDPVSASDAPLAARAFAPLSRPAQVHVRHFFPPRFDPPAEGHLVLMQPWEYGYLPRDWVAPIRAGVAEVWCYSEYVRQVYLASGIDPAHVHVTPLGVDPDVFRPTAPPYVLTDEPGAARRTGRRPFVFAFVGGTIERKGIDILLEAWRRAFTPLDDVRLLIKDTGVQTVYRGQSARATILAMAADAGVAPVAYIEADLTPHQLAGVYTAADCLVMPYRGEGFLLPALEAMACGRPVIVPAGGPTDDFVDETVGWRIGAAHRLLDPPRVGHWDLAGPGWMFEVDPDELARLLRAVAAQPDEALARGDAARARVVAKWTWRRAARTVKRRLTHLARQPVPRRVAVGVPATPRQAARGSISLCMIVRNEERVLGNCLASIKPYVDEIIVVDTGSTDRTVAIAQEYGATIRHFAWIDDFSAARNESLRDAAGEWILWMDADDVMPEAVGRRLRETVLTADDSVGGLLMQVHCPPAPGLAGLTVVDHVKLVRNVPGIGFEGRIHEQVLESVYRTGGSVLRTDLHVVHAGYDHSPEGQERKRERDLRLLELDLAERPDHPFVLFNIGMTAFHMKDWPKAVGALERCLAVSGPRESMLRKVYAMLAGCAVECGDLARAKDWLDRGLADYPADPELLFRAGMAARELGDPPAAEAFYLRLLNGREAGHIDSLDVTMVGFKAHHNLALVYQDMGRLDQAAAHFGQAVQAEPGFVPSWLGLREMLARSERWDEVRAVEGRIAALQGGTMGC